MKALGRGLMVLGFAALAFGVFGFFKIQGLPADAAVQDFVSFVAKYRVWLSVGGLVVMLCGGAMSR